MAKIQVGGSVGKLNSAEAGSTIHDTTDKSSINRDERTVTTQTHAVGLGGFVIGCMVLCGILLVIGVLMASGTMTIDDILGLMRSVTGRG